MTTATTALLLAHEHTAASECERADAVGDGTDLAWCAWFVLIALVAIEWPHMRLRARRAWRRWGRR